MKVKAIVENGFIKTGIGLIPEDWKTITLEDEKLFEFTNGLWKGKKAPFVTIKVIRNTNFNNDGSLSLSDVAELDVEEKQFIKRQLSEGDIILERSGGGPKQPVGRVVFFDLKMGNYSFSNFTTRIRVKDINKIQPKYILYYLLHFYNRGCTYELQQRTTGIRNLNFKDYKKTQVPLLSLTEQQKIIHVLSKIQQAIEQQDRIIETTRELKKSLMQKLFTEGLHGEEQKETEIGLMPKSWEVKCINEISDKLLGGGTPSTKISEYWNGNIHWTTSKKLGEQIYLFDGEKKITEQGVNNSSTSLIPKNNLLISTRVSVGKVVVNKEDIAISQDLTGTIINKKLYNAEFLAYQIKTIRIQKIFDEQKRGATIKGITREDLKGIKLTVPDLKEQTKIAVILLCLDKKLQQAESKKQTLQALFRTMLNQLMTGKVRVKDFDFEVKN